MIVPEPARANINGRGQTQNIRYHTFSPPTGGWVTNVPLDNQASNTAVVMENFWPTTNTIQPRGGTQLICQLDNSSADAMFEYNSNTSQKIFVANQTKIYELNKNSQQKNPVVSLSGQTSADYSTLQEQSIGGYKRLTIVNGTDQPRYYDGQRWRSVSLNSASTHTLYPERLSHVWSYRNRTFFVEKGTMVAWHLNVNAVSGRAHRLPLTSLFGKGGELLFGGRWSSDSGDGLDDRCVFVTSKGECAIYQGGDPTNANDWSLIGVYDIGEPLNKNAHVNVGGDLVIATKAGLLPLSAAITKDTTQLKPYIANRAIDPEWRFQNVLTKNKSGWKIVKWDSRNMALVAPPIAEGITSGYCWAVNLETGAWTKFTGWNVNAMLVVDDNLIYADSEGKVFEADTGGTDDGEPFECRACFGFNDMQAPGAIKTAQAIRGTWRFKRGFNPKHSVASDYRESFLSAPPPSEQLQIQNGGEGIWDTTEWETGEWGEGLNEWQMTSKWQSVSATGKALAPQIQIVSAQTPKLDCQLISVDMAYSQGQVIA